MIPAFSLRAFAPRDLGALADLWVAAWTATGLDIDFRARRPWLEEHLSALHAARVDIVVACEDGGAAVGFVTLDRETGYLDQLCVAAAAQGRGLARALVGEAKRRAPGRLDLHVNVENPRARAFYARAGFVVIGEAKSPLSGRPTLHMQWRAEADGYGAAYKPGR